MEGEHESNGSRTTSNDDDASRSSQPRGRQWEDKNAIEYDAGKQCLSKIPRDSIKETTHTKIKIPRRGFSPGDRVNISIPIDCDPDTPEFNLCLANVRMGSLPRDVLWQRMRGKVQTIYVKGVPQGRSASSRASPASSTVAITAASS